RQKRKDTQGEQPNAEGKWGKPRIHETLGEPALQLPADSARGDGSDRNAEQDWSDDAGAGKDPSPAALGCIVLAVVGSKGERGTTEDDPHQHQRQWNVEDRTEPGKHRWKARKGEDDGKDQPDMIGFPDGADRMSDDFALPASAGAARQHVPHTAAKVRAAEQYVRVERKPQHCRQDVRQAQVRHDAAPVASIPDSTRWISGFE